MPCSQPIIMLEPLHVYYYVCNHANHKTGPEAPGLEGAVYFVVAIVIPINGVIG